MSVDDKGCPICGEGQLWARVEKNQAAYKGQSASLDVYYSVCDVCQSEQASAVQIRDNKRLMIAFKKQVDGLLTGAEVRAVREQLSISQAEAARIFGGGPVAFSKYESDDVAQSEAMDKLLRVAVEVPEAFAHLAQQTRDAPTRTGDWRRTHVASRASSSKRPVLKIVSANPIHSDGGWRKVS